MPRMRWIDEVTKDLRSMGADLEPTRGQRSWRHVVGETKDHLGFQWPQKGEREMRKQVIRGTLEERRPLRRPRMRWIDEVTKDLRSMGADLELAEDRGSWRHMVVEAKDHLGFQWPQEQE
ncbi:uncharacterized protein LOC128989233 [Macrosteles quadrilineatus]|uniref:uncharacterized protein LOC128989233 n=1 Tax=Macrosteles quadrilineatus TaxID=74068 RepID=UPI0023E1C6DC|nr:uncharacterized protein LOC128989233 [Macrosteles quadrilineatus]